MTCLPHFILCLCLTTLISFAASSRVQDEPKSEMLQELSVCEEKYEYSDLIKRTVKCPESDDSLDKIYCCGTERNRYCCDTKLGLNQEDLDWIADNVGAFVAIVLAVMLILVVCVCVCCCCLPCCLLAKRRERSRGAVHGAPMTVVAQPPLPQQQQYYPPQQGYAPVPQQGYPQQGYPQQGYPQPGYPQYNQQAPPPYAAVEYTQPSAETQKQPAFNPNYAS